MTASAQSTDSKSSQSIAALKKQAASGNATAQGSLGDRYYYGRGVPQDYAQAANWYRKAAVQGEATAQWSLG